MNKHVRKPLPDGLGFMDDKLHFPVDLYHGTAEYYDRCRLPYPEAMTEDLIARAGVSGQGRLLDLACGTGQLAFPLRRSFAEVWAVDREPDFAQMVQAKATSWAPGTSARSQRTPRPSTRNPGTSNWPSSAAPSTASTATWSPPGCCTGCGQADAWRCAGRTSRSWVTGTGSERSRRCLTGGRPR